MKLHDSALLPNGHRQQGCHVQPAQVWLGLVWMLGYDWGCCSEVTSQQSEYATKYPAAPPDAFVYGLDVV